MSVGDTTPQPAGQNDVESAAAMASSQTKIDDDIQETTVTGNNAETIATDDNATDLLCGMKRRTAYIATATISAVLIVGITLAVIYGRPASWKLTVEYTGGPNFGGAMMISSDGSTLALLEESRGHNDQGTIGVQVIPTISSNEDRKAAVRLSPFLQVDEEYPLPANSEFGDDFIPEWTYYDFSLSGDGNMIAILGTAFFREEYRYDKGFRFHCNTTVVDPSDRFMFERCIYSRVTIFKRENSSSKWKSFGQPIEHMMNENGLGRRLDVSLSKNGKRLAIGYAGGVDIYQQDEDDVWVKVGNSILHGAVCGAPFSGDPVCAFGSSISLDNEGESIAVTGRFEFGGIEDELSKTAVYKLMGDTWEVKGEEIPISLPLTVSLSDSGNRVAVASLSRTGYDDPPAFLTIFDYDADNDSWLQLPSIGGFQECCNDSTAGYGVSISGDGNTIVYHKLAQPYRFGGNEWSPVGQALESERGDVPLVSITGDGNRVVKGEVSFFSGDSWVKVYDLRKGI